jgi:hypothetical protein
LVHGGIGGPCYNCLERDKTRRYRIKKTIDRCLCSRLRICSCNDSWFVRRQQRLYNMAETASIGWQPPSKGGMKCNVDVAILASFTSFTLVCMCILTMIEVNFSKQRLCGLKSHPDYISKSIGFERNYNLV